ncbi:MAG: hypothetical protein V4692_07380 [Bdellovibrionota bacterium]
MRNITSPQGGFITIDFIFAITIAIGFSVVLLAISFTLSMVEVGQYVTYAVSRAYNGAHATESQQRDLALAKYSEIMASPVLSRIMGSGWVVFKNPRVADFSEEYEQEENPVFVGARVDFEARVLNIKIPMLGSTSENPSTGKATLNSYLLREPSTTECRDAFNKQRYEKLLELHDSYRNVPGQHNAVLVTDNAC